MNPVRLSTHLLITITALTTFLGNSPATAAQPVGWRSDGTGRYPQATPPTVWSAEKNVLWKTKLPGRSHSGPVVVGDRVFVASEPNELICLSAADGKILWQTAFTTIDVFGEKKAAQIEADRAKAKELQQQQRKLRRELKDLRNAEGTPKEKIDKLNQQVRELKDKIRELTKYSGSIRGSNGNTTATPVCDGKNIIVVFGNGVVSSHTIAGKRNWIKFVEAPRIGFGHSASPVIADGKVIVHYGNLIALDAKTGREFWRAKVQPRHGSSIVARIGLTDVVVTPSGSVIRASDGVALAEKLFRLGHSSPLLHDGVIYAMPGGKTVAFPLPKSAETGLEWKLKWEGTGMRGRRFASPVCHDGLIYGVTEKGIFEVLDAQDGKLVYRKRLSFGRRGRVYPSPTVAGNYLYLSANRSNSHPALPASARDVGINAD
ncbi:MAG: PQQ-binding-like beta-propeller repeat protein [Planctomycetes bacterium]|nr:PQQ-binding-like beta-propeller repeat protein [Planctomycetota bacterium]